DGRPGEDELAALLATHRPEALPLSCGYFDQQLQPLGALGAAMARAAGKPSAWGRQPTEGLPDLREWFANEVGGGLRAADFTICSGGQPALAAAFRGLGRPGEVVLVEAPTYLGAMAAARDAGLRVVGVPTDEHGVRPDLLAAPFRTTGARRFYCQPLHANPHGAVLSAERRAAVLDVVAEAKAFLIADDYARGLTLDGCAPPPLSVDDNDGHVIYVRSLTKVVAPGMRLSAIGARGVAAARLAPPPALPTHRPPATARRPGRSAADPHPVARRHGPQRRPAPVAPPPGRLGRADDHGRGHGPRTRGLPRPPVVRRRTHRPIP